MILFQDSGQTPERRNEEATRIVGMLYEAYGFICDNMTDKEVSFLSNMFVIYERHEFKTVFVTPKQLFWLRDLKDKYLK